MHQDVTKRTSVFFARYQYRNIGKESEAWILLGSFANTESGHARLIARFNKRDIGKWFWRWERIQPGEIGYRKGWDDQIPAGLTPIAS